MSPPLVADADGPRVLRGECPMLYDPEIDIRAAPIDGIDGY